MITLSILAKEAMLFAYSPPPQIPMPSSSSIPSLIYSSDGECLRVQSSLSLSFAQDGQSPLETLATFTV